jgi:hypothetical protein
MKALSTVALAGVLALLAGPSSADQVNLAFGGDSYAAGQITTISEPVARDAFLAGYDVTLSGPVTGDAHMAGYTVNSNADVSGDLYAAGYSVTVLKTVEGDITAMGNLVALRSVTPVTGNVRVAGGSVVIDTPVAGSILATAAAMTLNSTVAGDLNFYGESLAFGPNAKVSGKVSIQAPREIVVPAEVAAADRVSFRLLETPDYASEAGKTAQNLVRGFWFAVWVTVLWWLLLFVVGAAFITLAPRLVEKLRIASSAHAFRRLGLGVLAFAATVGLVPVFAFTVIGLLLEPFVLIFVIAACSAAYLAGVYFIGNRIISAITPVGSNGRRVGVLAASLVAGGLLTMVPLIGWLITLLLLTFGFGVIGVVMMARWSAGDAERLTVGDVPAAAASTI